MRNCATALLAALLAVACARQPPTAETLSARFTDSPETFETLKRMIAEDASGAGCTSVGLDHIGDYWKLGQDWYREGDMTTPHTLRDVLARYGVSESRFANYRRLFNRIEAERVTQCHGGARGLWVSILVYRRGLAVSGCSGDISWSEFAPSSTGSRDGGYFTEVTEITGGWYLEYACT